MEKQACTKCKFISIVSYHQIKVMIGCSISSRHIAETREDVLKSYKIQKYTLKILYK